MKMVAEMTRTPFVVDWCEGSPRADVVRGANSLKFACEANILLADTFQDDLAASASHHPFQAMVAVLALEDARRDELGQHLEPLHRRGGRVERRRHGRPRENAVVPGGEGRSRGGCIAEHGGRMHER